MPFHLLRLKKLCNWGNKKNNTSKSCCYQQLKNFCASCDIIDLVSGLLHPSTLLYAPDIKFFDTHFITDKNLETNLKGIFVAGDGAGKSRGIAGAGISGIIAAGGIFRKYF